jgi:hypoxanthine phosphoribosyltransferase
MKLLYDVDDIHANIIEQVLDVKCTFRDQKVVFLALVEGGRRYGETVFNSFNGFSTYYTLSAKRTHKTVLGDVRIENYNALGVEHFAEQNVVILDDIFDEGRTILEAINWVVQFKPRAVEFCTMLEKAKNRLPLYSLSSGLSVDNDDWVVGYGMDLDGKHRELNGIYVV